MCHCWRVWTHVILGSLKCTASNSSTYRCVIQPQLYRQLRCELQPRCAPETAWVCYWRVYDLDKFDPSRPGIGIVCAGTHLQRHWQLEILARRILHSNLELVITHFQIVIPWSNVITMSQQLLNKWFSFTELWRSAWTKSVWIMYECTECPERSSVMHPSP